MLTLDNTRLRPVKSEDADKFIIWMNDPKITENLVCTKPITLTEEQKWINSLETNNSEVVFTIESIEQEGDIVIGSTGLHKINWINHSATFGIVIGRSEYWSKGYGSRVLKLVLEYGFNSLNLHRIESSVYSFNEKSINLHKKFFQQEGIKREAVYKNGKYHDVVYFGLLRKNYKV